jgi:hypothetical protein
MTPHITENNTEIIFKISVPSMNTQIHFSEVYLTIIHADQVMTDFCFDYKITNFLRIHQIIHHSVQFTLLHSYENSVSLPKSPVASELASDKVCKALMHILWILLYTPTQAITMRNMRNTFKKTP